ncbi:MAG: cyclic nucleotide-binding domain-containing protein [Anaerolineaceae bacterium]|nr:cyclic nucleotide-binding domain-containing protein [Anaerolineaceae bacterium]
MMEDSTELPLSAIGQLLRAMPLFSALSDDELIALESQLKPLTILSGQPIYEQGQPIQGLLFLKAGVADLRSAEGHLLCQLRRADLLCEEVLLGAQLYQFSAFAETTCELLFYPLSYFKADLQRLPGLAETSHVLAQSRLLAGRTPLPWLQKGEAVQLMTRKHPFFLFLGGLLPLVAFALLLIATNYLPFINGSMQLVLLIVGFVFCGLWLLWNLHNWANDYYVITNRRLIWMERLSGLYDSRQEAPLSTLISTGIETTRKGSLLGFSDLIVRTFVGDIRFRQLGHAEAIAKMVEAYWFGKKHKAKDLDEESIRSALRKKFGKPIQELTPQEMRQVQPALFTEPEQSFEFNDWLFSDFLKVRFEVGDTITYRKHWWVMLRTTFLPFMGILLAFGVLAGASSYRINFLNHQMLMIVSVFFLLAMLFWWFYAYTDWKNDLFEINPSQVIDIDRKPLGKESRRVAPLESILSIHYEKRGLLQVGLNFGTVYISVGNQQLTFDDVYDPGTVQQEVFSRMGERQEQTDRAEADAEKDRLAQWFRLYHEEISASGLAESSQAAHQLPPKDSNPPFQPHG